MFINKSSVKTNEILSSQTFGMLNRASQESQIQGENLNYSNIDNSGAKTQMQGPKIQSRVDLPSDYSKKRYPSLHRQSKQIDRNYPLAARSSLNLISSGNHTESKDLKATSGMHLS